MHLKAIFLINFFLLLCANVYSQLFLQLERYNNPVSIKFQIDEPLEFRLKEFPKTWRKEVIINLIPEEQLIVFEDSYYHIDEIKEIRRRFPTVKSIGTKLMQFSAAWFVYGGIATLASSDYQMSASEIIVGATAAGIGYIIRELFSKKKIKLNDRRRLRVMDTRFDPLKGY